VEDSPPLSRGVQPLILLPQLHTGQQLTQWCLSHLPRTSGVAIALICKSPNPRMHKLMRLNVSGNFTEGEFLGQIVLVLLHSDRTTPCDGRVFQQRDHTMKSSSTQFTVDCFAMIWTVAHNFFCDDCVYYRHSSISCFGLQHFLEIELILTNTETSSFTLTLLFNREIA